MHEFLVRWYSSGADAWIIEAPTAADALTIWKAHMTGSRGIQNPQPTEILYVTRLSAVRRLESGKE